MGFVLMKIHSSKIFHFLENIWICSLCQHYIIYHSCNYFVTVFLEIQNSAQNINSI